jgi:hypothetical protein
VQTTINDPRDLKVFLEGDPEGTPKWPTTRRTGLPPFFGPREMGVALVI